MRKCSCSTMLFMCVFRGGKQAHSNAQRAEGVDHTCRELSDLNSGVECLRTCERFGLRKGNSIGLLNPLSLFLRPFQWSQVLLEKMAGGFSIFQPHHSKAPSLPCLSFGPLQNLPMGKAACILAPQDLSNLLKLP